MVVRGCGGDDGGGGDEDGGVGYLRWWRWREGLHYLLDKVVQDGLHQDPTTATITTITITNGDGMQRVRTFKKQYPHNKVQQMGGARGSVYAIDGRIGKGRRSRGGRSGFDGMGEESATIGESSATMRGQGNDGMGQRGRGRGQRGIGRGQMLRDEEDMTEDETRKHLEHEYMKEILLEEEQKREAYQTEQDEFNQEALRYTLEEEAMYKREDEERLRKQMAE
nr:hypothetical protein [Tanacetum cinerariifolium]